MAQKTLLFTLLFLSFGIFLSVPSMAAEPAKKEALKALRTIIIDPGHGGENEGCIGPTQVREKVVALQIALQVEKALLEQTDATVILTRRQDVYVGLRERTRFANAKNGDVFISIHMNASPTGSGIGLETFLLNSKSSSEEVNALVAREQEDLPINASTTEVRKEELDTLIYDLELRAAHSISEKLASLVQRVLVAKTGATDRGVKQAPFAVLKEAEMPAIVLECGFLTHPVEGAKLLDLEYQVKLANGLTRALIKFDDVLSAENEDSP